MTEIVKKKAICPLDEVAIRTLNELMTNLESEIKKFENALNTSFSWKSLQNDAEGIYELTNAIKEKLSNAGIPSSSVSSMHQHAFYMKKYANEKNRSPIDRNLISLKIKFKNVNEEIERAAKDLFLISNEIVKEIESIIDPIAKGYLDESCRCLSAGAYRASIVMSGCALESLVRNIYRETMKKDPSKIPFANLVEQLENTHNLSKDQSAIIHICRNFRNLTSHPSGFESTKGDAEALIKLVIEQIKKCQ